MNAADTRFSPRLISRSDRDQFARNVHGMQRKILIEIKDEYV